MLVSRGQVVMHGFIMKHTMIIAEFAVIGICVVVVVIKRRKKCHTEQDNQAMR